MDIEDIVKLYQEKYKAVQFKLEELPKYFNDIRIGESTLDDIRKNGVYCQSECLMTSDHIKYCLFFNDGVLINYPTYCSHNILKNGIPFIKGTILFILLDDEGEIEFSIYTCLDLSKEKLDSLFYV